MCLEIQDLLVLDLPGVNILSGLEFPKGKSHRFSLDRSLSWMSRTPKVPVPSDA
jgi:hypothetical protein